jgi:hypothetical protein
MFAQHFSPALYNPREVKYTHRMLKQLLDDPEKYREYMSL